jgi:hypothetical protein
VTAVLAPPPAAAADRVVIRTYDASGLPEDDRAAAFAAARAILEGAGLAVARLACELVDAEATGGCRLPLRPDELSVRLVRLPADGPAALRLRSGHAERQSRGEAGRPVRGADPVTLGYSLVEMEVRFGSLATVYVDRVADLAAAAEVALPTLLGRAIAHEIGHLLLGTAAHARAGVMRAVWSPEAIRGSGAAEWRFTPRDAAALRESARRRAAYPLQTW